MTEKLKQREFNDASHYAQWLTDCFEYLYEAWGLEPRELTGNPAFLQIDYENGDTPGQSMCAWYEREFGRRP